MKKKSIALKNLALLSLVICLCIACDKDFATIESDIVNTDNATNFDVLSREFDVIAYSNPLPPVQTNNLPLNLLGVYNDPVYGQTIGTFVSQLRLSSYDPSFGTGVILDSVVINIPYFSTPTELTSDGETIFELDSVFGDSPMKLSIYESNYFLRDFDPSSSINESQLYYSDQTTGTSPISDALLEGNLLYTDEEFTPDPKQIIFENEDGDVTGRAIPALRISFSSDEDLQYWQEKIINKEGQSELSNVNNFNDYFRGIYFKVEPTDGNGSMSILNLIPESANITLHYTRDNTLPDSDPVQRTFSLRFTGNRVNFLTNDFVFPEGDEILGDERLYLKGGQGSNAIIKLFDGDNVDDDILFNSFEYFKNEFVEMDEDGNFVRNKKLVNEANLVFYVDQSSLGDIEEPERIYLYDMKNNFPTIDYLFDDANTISPLNSRTAHLGRLERDDNGNGVKYKIRITEHINNLLVRDSSNVDLGLVISGNVNLENTTRQFDILNPEDDNDKIPVSSIITQRGTVLFGNNTLDEQKKLYLEIFYTEPNN